MRLTKPIIFAAAVGIAGISAAHAAENRAMTVFKTPWCGCCEAWTERMEAEGFAVTVRDLDDLDAIKKQAGVPDELQGCHTAVLDNYVLEGHVPVEAIDKLMREQPAVRGIAVPGMPQGAPGMGDDPQARYTVYSFTHEAPTAGTVFYEAGK